MAYTYPLGTCTFKGCEAPATVIIQPVPEQQPFNRNARVEPLPPTFNRCTQHVDA